MVGFLVYPPKFVVLNFGRWSKKGYRRVNMSNQRLRAVVIGSILNLDVLVAWNLLWLIAALKAKGKIAWHNRGTPLLGTFRCWIKTCGFGEDSPWSSHVRSPGELLRQNQHSSSETQPAEWFWPQDAMKLLIFKTFRWIVLRLAIGSVFDMSCMNPWSFGSFGCPWCHSVPGLVSWPGHRWQ